eukprot:5616075-Lingulodinium_polyedra.AAC.1
MPPASAFLPHFDNFDAAVYQGRWGSIMYALKKLLPLQRPFRLAWSLQSWNLTGAGRPDRADPGGGQRTLN